MLYCLWLLTRLLLILRSILLLGCCRIKRAGGTQVLKRGHQVLYLVLTVVSSRCRCGSRQSGTHDWLRLGSSAIIIYLGVTINRHIMTLMLLVRLMLLLQVVVLRWLLRAIITMILLMVLRLLLRVVLHSHLLVAHRWLLRKSVLSSTAVPLLLLGMMTTNATLSLLLS